MSRIVQKRNLKNVTPLAVTKVGEKGRRLELTSATKKKQHARCTWIGTKERKFIFLNDLVRSTTDESVKCPAIAYDNCNGNGNFIYTKKTVLRKYAR